MVSIKKRVNDCAQGKTMGLKAFSRLGLYFLLAWTVTGAAAQQAVRLDLGWSATPSSEILPETPHPQTANSQSANSQSDTPSPAPEGTGQGAAPPSSGAPGSIHGVVTNLDGAVYEGAHIALALAAAPTGETVRQTASDSSGRFNFDDVPPGTFKLTVSAAGFAPQALVGTLHSAESYEAKAFTLAIGSTTADVEVTASTAEIAQAQLKEEETQRIFAIIPNFYVAWPGRPLLTRLRSSSPPAWRAPNRRPTV